MKDSEMRAKVIELIDIKFMNMSLHSSDGDRVTAEFVFDTLVGALDTSSWLNCITNNEREYIFNAALEALYR